MDEIGERTVGNSPCYEIVEHMADWAVRVCGRDFADLLLNAAAAMNMLLVGAEPVTGRDVVRHLELTAYDRESMLVEWLGELAYLAETEGNIFLDCRLETVTPEYLTATIIGGPVTQLQKHIKAVTYHNLEVLETDQGLEATIVFDV